MNKVTPVPASNPLAQHLTARAARIPSSYFNGQQTSFVLSVGDETLGIVIEAEALRVTAALPAAPAFAAAMSPQDFHSLETARSDVMTLLNTGRIRLSQVDAGANPLKVLQYAIMLILARWYLTDAAIASVEQPRPGYLCTRLDRIDASDTQGFRALAEQGTPVLIAGMANDWPMRRAGFDKLLDAARDIPVSLLRREHGPDSPAQYETSTLHDYVQSIRDLTGDAGNRPYLAANAIPEAMASVVGLPPQFPPSAFANTRMWIGPPGTGLNFHRDMVDNFIVQAFGRKNLSLIAPHHAADMLPQRLGGNPFYQPSGRYLGIEPEAAPVLKPETLAARIDVSLEEGDAIYLPAGWWHQVRNATLSWSFNFFAVNQPPVVLGHNPWESQNEQ
ncbi:cupin-like domain-containing protein [Tabrizicola aquatica]|uniref:cupin-like domain-containing protein n=1 Tax=Tabrizicola aquatica TaxID=909926 RepID=UPI000CD1C62B|nr:cupin-like domain-containing protein [Tabrizicola aquatica]